ncbi:Fe(3+) ABC transporter substrate-binding protein [Acaryochloris sp. IP29b_bin.137]|uniref:Fe(3+) ABC transporter substrate-binding protein n=1 Tax=Acaryochloris sp. IP29b_bin.137 TaxID=2969217 RepID=UPI0026046B74|nr:Fe(3+) ABC transporter substrate-binding protein [Acaryochloris sp. IP29b_bin.137]
MVTNLSKASVISAVSLLTLASGCTNQNPQTSGDSKVVSVYSARHYDTDRALYQDFTKQTGIEVKLLESKDNELLERIKNESNSPQADVLITVDAGRLWRAEQSKLLQPISSNTLNEKIPENLRHPDGLWFGLTKRVRMLVYNKSKVKPTELSTYEALTEPAWKGRVCIRSSNNIYNQSLLGSFIESKGETETEAWAKGLVANLARPPKGGDVDQIKAVAAGQCDVAIVNHYYVARLAQSKNPKNQAITEKVGVFFPNQDDRGTHVNISGAGVVANAPHKEHAIAFMEYLTSPEAQKIFADANNEYPAVIGVEASPALKQYGEFKSDTINVSAYGRNNPEATKIADRAGWP